MSVQLPEGVGQDMLSAGALRRRDLFGPEAVAALVAGGRVDRVDAALTSLALICIEVCCPEFGDRLCSFEPWS